MYVYFSIYSLYCLFIIYVTGAYSKHCFFFFENIHLEKLLTCLSALSLSVPAQVPFCDPTLGPVQWPSLCQAWAGAAEGFDSFWGFQAASSGTSCVTPGECPAGMAVGRGALDSLGCRPWPRGAEHPHRLRKAPTTPQGAGTRDCSILLAMSVFWGRKTQQALFIKNRSRINWNEGTFLVVQKFEPELNLPPPPPNLMLSIWKMCRISGFLQLVVIQECNKALPSLPSPPK